MNCSKVQKLIYLHAGNDLSQRKMKRLENHLSRCKSCVSELDKIKKSLKVATQTCDPQQDEIQTERMWQNIQKEIKSARAVQVKTKYSLLVERFQSFLSNILNFFKYKPLNIKLGFAASALILFAAIFLFQTQRTEKEPTIFAELKPHSSALEQYPTVEKVDKPGVTVLTMKTEDPHIKVVWFFDENLKL